MDILEQNIERMLRRRQLVLWNAIVSSYDIPKDINAKVHSWINLGIFQEQCTFKRNQQLIK